MSKLKSFILASAVLVSIAGCGGSSTTEPAQPAQNIASSSSTTITSPEISDASTQSAGKSGSGAETVEETVLVDDGGIRITAKELDVKNLMGPSLKLLVENDSDRDLTVQCRNASVNGYMIETTLSVNVTSGNKANASLVFSNSGLSACGIQEIADMEFCFHVFNTDSWETYFDSPKVQLLTSIADNYAYSFDDSGELAYEGNDVRVVIKGLAENGSILGPGILAYVENNGSSDITAQVRNVSVNGFMVDPSYSCEVCAGKRALQNITFMKSQLEENGIEAIKDVELSFHVFDSDSWDTIVDTETVHLSF